MTPRSDIIGVILAGGDSTRMGTDKALLVLDDLTLIEHVARTMRQVFKDVVVISNVPVKYSFLNLPTFPDIYRNCGPLAGFHSAFLHTHAPAVFVTACDTPFITKELIEHLITSPAEEDVRVPSHDGKLHPLCSYYSRASLPTIESHLGRQQFKIQEVFKELTIHRVPITNDLPFYKKHILSNINDLKEFKKFSGHLASLRK